MGILGGHGAFVLEAAELIFCLWRFEPNRRRVDDDDDVVSLSRNPAKKEVEAAAKDPNHTS